MKKLIIIIGWCLILGLISISGCVEKKHPTAILNIYADSPKLVDDIIIFSANGSKDSDGNIVEYIIDFGDGTSSLSKYLSHQYSSEGEYDITLHVIDNDGLSSTYETTIKIEPIPIINLNIDLLSYNESDRSLVFNITITGTSSGSVKTSDINYDFFTDTTGNSNPGSSGGLDNYYYDVEDGLVSSDDYIIYHYKFRLRETEDYEKCIFRLVYHQYIHNHQRLGEVTYIFD